ncbi:MAG: hypothetical protein HYT40_01590 [Candidatus Sungbacteria bacterium]|uniref:Uncharacterized protein n=1 Tax=Candidatus Sungiibacteriota bacterium TaxID=2750080 RepID=A0A931SD82_9BACT|nr:hypothetical protein [Candidatus Sungbacteria bacterium]
MDSESDYQKLRRLEEESREWYRTQRPKRFYESDCPGSMDENNRQITIRELRRKLNPPD